MNTSMSFAGLVFLAFLSSNPITLAAEPAPAALFRNPSSATAPEGPGSPVSSRFVIPGPRRSFMRMAAISQKASPEEILPLLSRNVQNLGYENLNPTEYLVLLRRYVVQARELTALAAKTDMVLRVTNCDDARPLLHILGYRVRPDCGEPHTSLQTADPERAFLSIDSGFPVPALERTLQGGKPFEYAYSSEPVPVLYAESDWTQLSKKNYTENSRDLLETILYDESVARLYWAVSRMDPETSQTLKESVGLKKLLPHGALLDFYGRELCISHGKVIVPGGAEAEGIWKEFVGASPAMPGSFVPKLLAKDQGWMAAYFDVLSRASAKQQHYFTNPQRFRLFYDGLLTVRLHNSTLNASATRGTFRPAPSLLFLATRLQFDESDEPLVPGGVEVWNKIIFHGLSSGVVRRWAKQTGPIKDSNQLLKVLFAFSRTPTDLSPLQEYLALCELDSRRPPQARLAPATVLLLARRFEEFNAQYRIFSEFPDLNDQAVVSFMKAAEDLSAVPMTDRGNAYGIFQANLALWQILARQGEIPRSQWNESWERIIKPFGGVRSGAQVFDAGQESLVQLFRFATGKAAVSQDRFIELLAGPAQTSAAGKQMHYEIATRIRSVLEDQRLVSLDTLMVVGAALKEKANGTQPDESAILLAGQTREFEMPRPIFSSGERSEWASGVYNNRHTDLQMKTDLPKILKTKTVPRRQLDEARGHLASFLRDTLVGLNYAYYEPPGAQDLHNNPLLVRSHDFAGESVAGLRLLWQSPQVFGQGSPAGGGAHLVGSLVDLPYALATVEQNFISPNNVQALVLEEMATELLAEAVVPRWWTVSRDELHAVALCQRSGEELLTASTKDAELRDQVLAILSARLLPHRLRLLDRALRADRFSDFVPEMMPADTFYLGQQFAEKYPAELSKFPGALEELGALSEHHPDLLSFQRLSRDFGIPHPAMAQNYGLELLDMRPMPALSGEASRFLAESWDSPNLYWARLADERGYDPVALNHLVPELTRMMIERIFASDIEDWPAFLRAMHESGEDYRDRISASHETVSANRP